MFQNSSVIRFVSLKYMLCLGWVLDKGLPVRFQEMATLNHEFQESWKHTFLKHVNHDILPQN